MNDLNVLKNRYSGKSNPMGKIILLAFVFVVNSNLALAAKPVKITPGPKMVDENSGESFRQYIVECSNGTRVPIESWVARKQWCLENGISLELCWKKQIKAAKKACKGGKPKILPNDPPRE